MDQGNLARVIQDVMQIIPIQSFHNDNVMMWLLGYLKRSPNLNGVTFSIVFFVSPQTDLNNVDNILVLAQLENILLVRQLIITIGLLFGHQFDGDWGC